MANTKFSQIADGGAYVPSTDQIMAVRSGTTDVLLTSNIPSLSTAQTFITGLKKFTNSLLAILGSSTGYTIFTSDNASATNYTHHLQAANGTLAFTAPAPQAAGATLAVTAAMSGKPILLDTAAGSVATLPAATGSGNKYPFFVTVSATSNAHKILPASVADFLMGIAIGEFLNSALSFAGNPAASHSIQMPFAGSQPSGGIKGDWFEFTDVAANLWAVKGMYQAGITATTPFSTATT